MKYLPITDPYYEEQINKLSASSSSLREEEGKDEADYLQIYVVENSEIRFYYPFLSNTYEFVIHKGIKPPKSHPSDVICYFQKTVKYTADKKAYFINFLKEKGRNELPKKKCDHCNKMISTTNWSKHLKSKKHLEL